MLHGGQSDGKRNNKARKWRRLWGIEKEGSQRIHRSSVNAQQTPEGGEEQAILLF